MRDCDHMHEEGGTLSTMCNTHTAHTTRFHSLANHTTAHLSPTLATLVHTPCTHPPNEMAAVYRAWVQGHSHISRHAHKGTAHSPSDVALAEVLMRSGLTDQQLHLATHINSFSSGKSLPEEEAPQLMSYGHRHLHCSPSFSIA